MHIFVKNNPRRFLFNNPLRVQRILGEIPIEFSFRGEIKNGQLNGPGKLSLSKKAPMDHSGTCLRLNKFMGLDLVEVVGNFANGVLSGNAKTVFSNGKILVGEFVDGLLEGLRREWNEDGNLTYAGFTHRGVKAGKAWVMIGSNLVYTDVATINRSDDLAIVLPFKNGTIGSVIIAGKLWPHYGILDEVQQVNIMGTSLVEQSCLMKLLVEPEGKALNAFYDLRLDKLISKSHSNRDEQSCQNFDAMDGGISQKLVNWCEHLNSRVAHKAFHQTVLEMKQEAEEPTSGTRIISDIAVDDKNAPSGSTSIPPTMSVTFFELQRSRVHVGVGSFDEQSRFHGLVQLQVETSADYKHHFGFDFTQVSGFGGVFNHGILEGLVQLDLKVIKTKILSIMTYLGCSAT